LGRIGHRRRRVRVGGNLGLGFAAGSIHCSVVASRAEGVTFRIQPVFTGSTAYMGRRFVVAVLAGSARARSARGAVRRRGRQAVAGTAPVRIFNGGIDS
jgi:hypothetical protein